MRKLGFLTLFGFSLCLPTLTTSPRGGPSPRKIDIEELRRGVGFIPTPVFSEEEDSRILKLFEGLRVSDVADGLDSLGLYHVGRVNPAIQPLWRDTVKFTHRIVGIAVTVRYVPTRERRHPGGQGYDKWVGKAYMEETPEPFLSLLRPGTCLVIEEAEGLDIGSIGSNNIMQWKLKGCVGVVTNGNARDTDEIIAERIPLYFRGPGRGIRPGRNQIESVNRPVVIGGATVVPGDVIVADGDGVLVVPRKFAEEVALYARKILIRDKASRRILYQKLGLPEDESVR